MGSGFHLRRFHVLLFLLHTLGLSDCLPDYLIVQKNITFDVLVTETTIQKAIDSARNDLSLRSEIPWIVDGVDYYKDIARNNSSNNNNNFDDNHQRKGNLCDVIGGIEEGGCVPNNSNNNNYSNDINSVGIKKEGGVGCGPKCNDGMSKYLSFDSKDNNYLYDNMINELERNKQDPPPFPSTIHETVFKTLITLHQTTYLRIAANLITKLSE